MRIGWSQPTKLGARLVPHRASQVFVKTRGPRGASALCKEASSRGSNEHQGRDGGTAAPIGRLRGAQLANNLILGVGLQNRVTGGH